jgi:hypothetical protein
MVLKFISRSIHKNHLDFKIFTLRCHKMLLEVLYFGQITFISLHFLIYKQSFKGGSIQCEFKTFINVLTKLFWLYMMKPYQTLKKESTQEKERKRNN